jgi:hypothetical protein
VHYTNKFKQLECVLFVHSSKQIALKTSALQANIHADASGINYNDFIIKIILITTT